VTMIESISAAVDVALLAAFALILGAFALLLWDFLQERMRGWLRVMVVVVLAPACALGATAISAGVGLGLASALGPEEPPAHTEPTDKDPNTRNLERTSAGPRGSETTTERRASPTPTPTASPTASPTATASPSASPSP
jgi:hypothetical protein